MYTPGAQDVPCTYGTPVGAQDCCVIVCNMLRAPGGYCHAGCCLRVVFGGSLPAPMMSCSQCLGLSFVVQLATFQRTPNASGEILHNSESRDDYRGSLQKDRTLRILYLIQCLM